MPHTDGGVRLALLTRRVLRGIMGVVLPVFLRSPHVNRVTCVLSVSSGILVVVVMVSQSVQSVRSSCHTCPPW